jgi:hypothetical protein
MVKLSDYIGQVLTDIAAGREMADRNSAALSERYQTDTFMKGMPVPHYTIDEASFELPFMIVGVVSRGKMDDGIVKEIINTTREKTTALIHCFIREKTGQGRKNGEADTGANSGAPGGRKNRDIINTLVENLIKQVRISIEQEGLKILKLLDLVDKLCSQLLEQIENAFPPQKTGAEDDAGTESEHPFANPENLREFEERYRRILFNEYKEVISTTNGVIIDPSTGKLNEYAEDNCLTHLKVTLREQDLDFIVELDEKSGKTKHFLALN